MLLVDSQGCDEGMLMVDCSGNEFCNNQPEYAEYTVMWLTKIVVILMERDCYDWVVMIIVMMGPGGLIFCNEYSWDCGDCDDPVIDDNGYCNDSLSQIGMKIARPHKEI